MQFAEDGRAIFVFRQKDGVAGVYKVSQPTGRAERVFDLAATDPSGGLGFIQDVLVTPDGKSCYFTRGRVASEDYLVEGLDVPGAAPLVRESARTRAEHSRG